MVYFLTINTLGSCATLLLLIYGGTGILTQGGLLWSQFYAILLFFEVISLAIGVSILLSSPISSEFLYQKLGRDYVESRISKNPNYPLIRLFMAMAGLFAVEVGANCGDLVNQEIAREKSRTTFSLVLEEQSRQSLGQLETTDTNTYSTILQDWDENSVGAQKVKTQMGSNIGEKENQFRTPLSRLASSMRGAIFKEN